MAEELTEAAAPASTARGRGRGGLLAAVDVGSTNCRMTLARPGRGGGFRPVQRFSRITRLGQGLETGGSLSETAMGRSVAALRRCAQLIDRRGAARVRAVATEACRRAINGTDFLERVYHETGLSLEVIPAEEEARLALAGCVGLLDPDCPRALVFDIGGGSSEIMWVGMEGRGRARLLGVQSLPVGVISLTEHFPCVGDYPQMVDYVSSFLGDIDAAFNVSCAVEKGCVQMLGTSGTVTTLAGVHLGLQRYDRQRVDGQVLDFGALDQAVRMLRTMGPNARRAHPCIGRHRADFVVAGCAIVDALCGVWPVGRLRVADRGVRDGLLRDLVRPGAVVRDGGEGAA